MVLDRISCSIRKFLRETWYVSKPKNLRKIVFTFHKNQKVSYKFSYFKNKLLKTPFTHAFEYATDTINY